ncbi:hypothetical protein C2E23DRAFT_135175 [Lenzites betulinus]|nr:hypothetical protein C2E23DRAFT_135175 [Lenzites betulinus]
MNMTQTSPRAQYHRLHSSLVQQSRLMLESWLYHFSDVTRCTMSHGVPAPAATSRPRPARPGHARGPVTSLTTDSPAHRSTNTLPFHTFRANWARSMRSWSGSSECYRTQLQGSVPGDHRPTMETQQNLIFAAIANQHLNSDFIISLAADRHAPLSEHMRRKSPIINLRSSLLGVQLSYIDDHVRYNYCSKIQSGASHCPNYDRTLDMDRSHLAVKASRCLRQPQRILRQPWWSWFTSP